jgi:DNA-binding transcriptional regulator YhcF (GntR family)
MNGDRVRDRRQAGWFWVNDDVYDQYAGSSIGGHAFAVYAALCRYANARGECFPSIPTLAKRLGWSENTVRKGLRELEAAGLIGVRRRRVSGKQEADANLYLLLAVPKDPPDKARQVVQQVNHLVQQVNHRPSPGEPRVLHHVKGNQTQLNETHLTARGSAAGDGPVSELDGPDDDAQSNGGLGEPSMTPEEELNQILEAAGLDGRGVAATARELLAVMTAEQARDVADAVLEQVMSDDTGNIRNVAGLIRSKLRNAVAQAKRGAG